MKSDPTILTQPWPLGFEQGLEDELTSYKRWEPEEKELLPNMQENLSIVEGDEMSPKGPTAENREEQMEGHMLQRGPPPPDPKSGWVEAPDPTSELPPRCPPRPSMNSVSQPSASTNSIKTKKESTAQKLRRPKKPQRLLLHNSYVICSSKFLDCKLVLLQIGTKYRV